MNLKRFRVAAAVVLFLILGLAALSFPGLKQRYDVAAVDRYIRRVQPLLAADPRFREVRLNGYSCDCVMHPYIPVFGTVPTQRDWEALESLIRTSRVWSYDGEKCLWLSVLDPDEMEAGRFSGIWSEVAPAFAQDPAVLDLEG